MLLFISHCHGNGLVVWWHIRNVHTLATTADTHLDSYNCTAFSDNSIHYVKPHAMLDFEVLEACSQYMVSVSQLNQLDSCRCTQLGTVVIQDSCSCVQLGILWHINNY